MVHNKYSDHEPIALTLGPLTFAVPVTVSSLSAEVESTGEQQPACLPEGSSVILTCGFNGFPRPTFRFRKDSQAIPLQISDSCSRLATNFNQVEFVCSVCPRFAPLASKGTIGIQLKSYYTYKFPFLF